MDRMYVRDRDSVALGTGVWPTLLLLFLWLMWLPHDALAASAGISGNGSSTVVIGDGHVSELLTQRLGYLEDRHRQWDVVEAAQHPFASAADFQFANLLPLDGALWLKLSLRYEGQQPRRQLVLTGLDANYAQISFFRRDGGGGYEQSLAGVFYPYSARETARTSTLYDYHLELPRGVTQTYYLRVEQFLPRKQQGFVLRDSDSKFRETIYGALVAGFLYGSMVALLLYNACVGLISRVRVYAVLVAWQTSALFAMLIMDGIGYHMIWPQQGWMQYLGGNLLGVLTSVIWLLLMDQVCGVSKIYPRLFQFMLTLQGVNFAATFVLFDQIAFLCQLVAVPISVICLVLQLGMLIDLSCKRHPGARYLLLADFFLVCGGLMITIVGLFDVIDSVHMLTYFGVSIGVVLCSITLSAYLADRIKRDQISLQRSQAAVIAANKRANAAKNNFLTAMSHELRTPITAIQGVMEQVSDSLEGPLQQLLQTGMKSLHQLTRSMDNLLLFTDLHTNQLQNRRSRVPLNLFLVQLREYVEQNHNIERIHFSLHCQIDSQQVVEVDQVKLLAVLVQLLDNAFAYSDSGEVKVDVNYLDEHLLIKVIDQGIGFDETKMEAMIGAFSQLDSGFSRRYGGLGLGLALARSLSEVLDARLQAESEVGQGSCFSLYIPTPLLPKTKHDMRPRLCYDQLLNEQHCLVVEDNPINQMLLQTALRKLGAEVAVASDGAEAFEVANQQVFDVILMDCQMPNVDGFEATKQIRLRSHQNRTTPIIAVTANVMEADRVRCLTVGMNAFLAKPYSQDQLVKALMNLLRLH